MTGHIAVGDRVPLNAGFHAARTRLRNLARDGMLQPACEVAYGEGVAALAELASPAARLTRLADVCLADLTEPGDRAHIALQWDAIDADGTLFTALLADLLLAPAGEHACALSLAGAYGPPPGLASTGPGQVIMHCCVTAITSSFLDLVACQISARRFLLRHLASAYWTPHVRKSSTSAANSAWYWNRNPCAASG